MADAIIVNRRKKGASKPAIPDKISLNDASWEEIRAVSDAGLAAEYWAAGDRKAVTLDGTVGGIKFTGQTYYCHILGIDHNTALEGGGRIHFMFGSAALSGGADITFSSLQMSAKSNVGGWKDSDMRKLYCEAFRSALPPELQAVLKTVEKYTNNTGGAYPPDGCVTATTDTVFIPSEFEVFGARTSAFTGEQEFQAQYDYFKSGGKVRYRHNAAGTASHWYLRSPYDRNASSYCCVTSAGLSNLLDYSTLQGFSPCFAV